MPRRGISSCCTLVENSQLYGRLPQPKRVSRLNCAMDVSVPNGCRYAEHSPLATELIMSQSGLKLPRRGSPTGYVRSSQFLVVVVLTPAGLPIVNSVSMYLPRLALTAVLPLPNRSYEAPSRGVMSCML